MPRSTSNFNSGLKYIPVLGGEDGAYPVLSQLPSPPVVPAVIEVQNSGLSVETVQIF